MVDISRSYRYSSVIFYGKYLSTDTVKMFNNIFGNPLIVENFEIVRFYKGVSLKLFNYLKNERGHYRISLISSCKESCGICFQERNKMYLVYAYLDFSGHLTTSGCTRTRQIIKDDFISKISFDPNLGVDENKMLEVEQEKNKSDEELIKGERKFNSEKELIKIQLKETKENLANRNLLIYILAGIVLILAGVLIYRF